MALTMLRKTAKQRARKEAAKALKKRNSFDNTQKAINRHTHDELAHAKVSVMVYTLEFFENVHQVLDYIEEHLPDEFKRIKHLSDEIDRREAEWLSEKFCKTLPERADRNQYITLVGRHAHNKDMVAWQERLAKSVSMRAVKCRYSRPHLLGWCLRLDIALQFLLRCNEKQYTNMKAAATLSGIGFKYSALWEKEFDSVALHDPDKLIDPITEILLDRMGITIQTYNHFISTGKLATDIYDYSVDFYKLYSRYFLNETQQICAAV